MLQDDYLYVKLDVLVDDIKETYYVVMQPTEDQSWYQTGLKGEAIQSAPGLVDLLWEVGSENKLSFEKLPYDEEISVFATLLSLQLVLIHGVDK